MWYLKSKRITYKKTSSFFCILKKYGKRQILFFYIFFPSFIKTVIHHGLYFSFQLYFLYFSGLNPSISFCLSDFLSAFVLKTLFILSLRTNIKRLFAFAYQQYNDQAILFRLRFTRLMSILSLATISISAYKAKLFTH